MSSSKSLLQTYLTIFIVVAAYWIVSILTVFVNKALLSDIDLDAPLFIAFYQTVITALICILIKNFSSMFTEWQFPETKVFYWQTIRDVLPLTIMFTTMIVANNLCLKYVSVAFYYIGRSLTTIFNVVFTYLILNDTTSKKCLLCCFFIVFGFLLGVDQENLAGSLSVTGTIFGIVGSLSLSLYSIFTKKVLPKVNQEVWLLSYYNNIYASIILYFIILFNGEISEVLKYDKLLQPMFWIIMTVGGVCGFSIGFLTSLQIKVTSALTHNISGTAKACAQTILATFWYNEHKSFMWWLSNFVILFSSAGYARIKQVDMEKKHRESPSYTKV